MVTSPRCAAPIWKVATPAIPKRIRPTASNTTPRAPAKQSSASAKTTIPPMITQRRPTRSDNIPIGSARKSPTNPPIPFSTPIVWRSMPSCRACSGKVGMTTPATISASTITRQIAATSPGIRTRRTNGDAPTINRAIPPLSRYLDTHLSSGPSGPLAGFIRRIP